MTGPDEYDGQKPEGYGEPEPYRPGAAKRRGPAPHIRLAGALMEAHRFVQDPTGAVFLYNGRHWEELSESSFDAMAFAADDAGKSLRRVRSEAVDHVKAATHKRDLEWGRLGDWEIACANGVLDVTTGAVRPHRPEDYLEWTLPWAYDPDARAQEWEAALALYFGEDVHKWDALQEFFGYACVGYARLKKALLLYGASDTGKSQVVLALKMLVGERNTCSLPVTEMDDPRRLVVLVGKALNIMTELSADAMIADGGFKTLVSTGEPVLVDPKYRNQFMYTPFAKHVVATNNLPNINDRTEATFNRLLLVPFLNAIPKDQQRPDIVEAFQAEMPGILAWAVEGARRLAANGGRFTEIGSAMDLMTEFRAESNPVIAFVGERLKRDESSAEPLSVLVQEYNRWIGGGRRRDVRWIGRMLRAAGFTTGRAYHDSGGRATALLGYRLNVADQFKWTVEAEQGPVIEGADE